MRLKFALPLAAAAVSFSLTTTSQAVTYTELPSDAGDLPGTAQVTTGTTGTTLTGISGTTTAIGTTGLFDSDMFEIYIANPSTFSASTTAFVVGANNFDSQLSLFTLGGVGVVSNDDAASGGEQSAIAAGSVTGAAGYYYLLLSGSGRYATSAGGLIFPNYTDGVTDPSATVGPTGPGGGSAITGYTGNTNEGGRYSIALTGAQFAAFTPVPEPGALAYVLAGAAGLALVLRSRRQAAR